MTSPTASSARQGPETTGDLIIDAALDAVADAAGAYARAREELDRAADRRRSAILDAHILGAPKAVIARRANTSRKVIVDLCR